MTTLTLLVKAKHAGQLRQITEILDEQFKELDIEIQILISQNRWVQVSLSGEDESIATAYINKTFGTCPVSVENAKSSSILKGYISRIDFDKQEVWVDVGVIEPKVVQAILPVTLLQSQLLDRKKVGLQKIAELYGLAQGLPLKVKINWENSKEETLLAEFSEEQVQVFDSWSQSLLDRLVILGASRDLVESVLARTRLNRDVIDVDELGMFEFVLVCKLGTAAAGLVSQIGRYMRNSVFVVFNAEKLWSFRNKPLVDF